MSWNDLRKGRFSQDRGEYFITFVCTDRIRYFSDHSAAHIFCQQLKLNEQSHGCVWLAWVLMPNHFHGLLQLGPSTLGKAVGHLKGLSAKRINEKTGRNRALWQSAYFDRAIRAEEDRIAIARYIVANPIRSGLVNDLSHYPYWNSTYL
ncbi:REP-associated tyrosine transposase [Reinekea marinisedimentorum]|uniref:REP element-mobilizing transposase RayT n=1 Tax=Reinekea marinisedimentorum TaxID=230495 RepID=A0A4R3HSS4_9GAMM|nr:transposase [Reinekea marinisedimentorum]TCS35191.1 REP element-mobilizing transposase RayT [Reinekea marinisedimentorum]